MSRLERKVVMPEDRPIRVYAQFPAPLRLCGFGYRQSIHGAI